MQTCIRASSWRVWEEDAFTFRLPLNPVLTWPRQESEMGTRTLFLTGLLRVPNGRTAQGTDAKLGARRLHGARAPRPILGCPSSYD